MILYQKYLNYYGKTYGTMEKNMVLKETIVFLLLGGGRLRKMPSPSSGFGVSRTITIFHSSLPRGSDLTVARETYSIRHDYRASPWSKHVNANALFRDVGQHCKPLTNSVCLEDRPCGDCRYSWRMRDKNTLMRR